MPDAPVVTPPAAPAAPAAPPAAPAADAPPAAPAAPTPPAAPAAPAAPSGDSLPDDPAALKTMIAQLRQENGAARTTAKAQAAEAARTELAQTIGKALGLVEDDTLDPAKLTASLTTSQAEAKQARAGLAVFEHATSIEQAKALLDSASFLKSLESVDTADAAAVQAAITTAVAANPRLGAAPEVKVPAPTPGQGAGGAGAVDLQTQLAEATKAGDIQRSIAIRQQIAKETKQ